jgi:hypothetical protein
VRKWMQSPALESLAFSTLPSNFEVRSCAMRARP